MGNLLTNIENIAKELLEAVSGSDTTVNSTGQELVLTFKDTIKPFTIGPNTTVVPLYTQVELGIAKGFIAMLQRIGTTEPGGVEIDVELEHVEDQSAGGEGVVGKPSGVFGGDSGGGGGGAGGQRGAGGDSGGWVIGLVVARESREATDSRESIGRGNRFP